MESQWGPVHLFDVCLRCDHLGMALALAAHSIPGCVLEVHHLGPFSRNSEFRLCDCQGWQTCRYCCWAFPVDQGIWMEDWDAALIAAGPVGAIPEACQAASTPITSAMLHLCSSDMDLPFSVSPHAMARLLDIAILTGNRAAAVNLSLPCQVRPLRRWAMDWRFEDAWQAARTALWAGADFQGILVPTIDEAIPFPQAMFLKSKLEDWQEIRHLLPGRHDLWRPRSLDNNRFGHFFLEGPHGPGGGWKLSLDKIRAAEDAKVDVRFCCVSVGDLGSASVWQWKGREASAVVILEGHAFFEPASVTLLDMAIWSGQPDCVEACVDAGIELKGDDRPLALHQGVLRGESLSLHHLPTPVDIDAEPSDAQTAAAAAACAWLRRLWRSESSQKGIVLYQFMLKMFKGRPFPMLLVQETLTYSMPVPKIIDQLDLWEHVGDWMASIASFCGPFAPAAAHVDGMDVEVESGGLEGPCASDGHQQCTTTCTIG